MMDLLEFLNSSDAETLQKQTGLTAAQSEKVTAARPFATLDDFVKVKGMSEKKLAAVKETYEKGLAMETPLEEPAAEPVEVEPVEERESEPETPRRKGSAGKVIGWIIVLLLLAGAAYAAIKWGVPFVYEKYVKPVENNAAEITDLASQQSAEVTRLNEEIAALQERVTTLEGRADAVDQSLNAHDEALTQLESLQKLLNEQMAAQKSELLDDLTMQVNLTRAIELLSRSRLYLSDSNFGLAKTDLQNCRNLLFTLLDQLPAEQNDALKVVIERLDKAISNLPAYPVVAVYDVDTAWQYLVDGLPNVPEQAVTPVVLPVTETPAATETVETTKEATPETTPEVTATP